MAQCFDGGSVNDGRYIEMQVRVRHSLSLMAQLKLDRRHIVMQVPVRLSLSVPAHSFVDGTVDV